MTSDKRATEQMFEGLSSLYQEDPEKFEEQRRLLIAQTIESFPEECRQRAYGLQFTIDCRLRKYKDPIMRMNKMVEIFWQQFAQFQETINDPEKIMLERRAARHNAKIIPLRGRDEYPSSNQPH
ncbi:DUF3135 domain-containing protein [Geoalkalibacter sp.]|uniref:DUF3135 domain-containing protein n=1 Tax=Geoalkalibacter sp. TaxID=3041440 RepID=UPI00272E762E|nr:DUF3135 domain-containing protein [Geoalkalibacter sp.]